MEDKPAYLLVCHLLKFTFGNQTIGNGLLANLVKVEATAIIFDLDDDMTTFMIGAQNNAAFL